MTRLLAAVPKFGGQGFIKEHNGLPERQGQLCCPEREHVHPCLPGDLLGCYAQGSDGIGEAGAVHVEVQVVFIGQLADRVNLIHRIDGAHFRRLRDGNSPVNLVVKIERLLQNTFYIIGQNLPGISVQDFHPGAAGEKSRTAAFGGGDMGLSVADNLVLRPADAGQRQ